MASTGTNFGDKQGRAQSHRSQRTDKQQRLIKFVIERYSCASNSLSLIALDFYPKYLLRAQRSACCRDMHHGGFPRLVFCSGKEEISLEIRPQPDWLIENPFGRLLMAGEARQSQCKFDVHRCHLINGSKSEVRGPTFSPTSLGGKLPSLTRVGISRSATVL